MRDVFYTILVVWIIWRVLNAVSSVRTKQTNSSSNFNSKTSRKEGETTVDFIPPKKNTFGDSEGEYVDYEEVK